jgi:diaminopimelate decarboxylase
MPLHAARPARNDVQLAPAEIGDLVIIFMAGAYELTASPTALLSHQQPPEVLVQ